MNGLISFGSTKLMGVGMASTKQTKKIKQKVGKPTVNKPVEEETKTSESDLVALVREVFLKEAPDNTLHGEFKQLLGSPKRRERARRGLTRVIFVKGKPTRNLVESICTIRPKWMTDLSWSRLKTAWTTLTLE